MGSKCGDGGGAARAQPPDPLECAARARHRLLKKFYEKPPEDLSAFNIVTHYDVPAIDKRDGVLRIEFCSS